MALNSNYWPDGFGETTGDSLVTTGPWYTSGEVIYVSSVIGSNSNSGLERNQPVATLVYADSIAGDDNSIIILAADHDESLVTSLHIETTGLVIVGAGASGGEPTATLRTNSGSGSILSLSATRCELRNVKLATAAQSNTGDRIAIGNGVGTGVRNIIKDCRFEMTVLDQGPALRFFGGSSTTIEGCTFVSTGTAATGGVAIQQAGAWANLVVKDSTFDGGTAGFLGGVAYNGGAALTDCRFENISLLRGADMLLTASSQGRVNPVTTTGGARVVFS